MKTTKKSRPIEAGDVAAKTAAMKAALEIARKALQPLPEILKEAEPFLAKAHDAVFERFIPGRPRPGKTKTKFEELSRMLGIQCEVVQYELRSVRERIARFEDLLAESARAEIDKTEKRNP